MKELSEIKEGALVLLAENDIEKVNKFLLRELEEEYDILHKEIILLESRRSRSLKMKKSGLITEEQFRVSQNVISIEVKNLIKKLDESPVKKSYVSHASHASHTSHASLESSNEGFLQIIFFVQVLILIGIAILIYKSYSS